MVALNAWLELPYYDKWYDKSTGAPSNGAGPGDHCSAFVATGSYTRISRVVIGHNNWTSYSSGERWNIVFDITPGDGNRIIMDGMPGLIHCGDDFGINAAGIMITETTISSFTGFDPNGIPEFVRARKAMQYAESIDDFARIMKEGNNGGYANNWLIADRKTNEVASLELGLKNVTLLRTKDGFFVGSNFPNDPKLIKEETDFDPKDRSKSENARHARWLALMEENKGKIDIAAAREVPGRPLRRLRRQGGLQRAHTLRARRTLAPRHGHVAAALCARRRRAEQSGGFRRRGKNVLHRAARPRLRAQLQGRRAPGQTSRIRLAEGHAARHELARLDKVRHEVRMFLAGAKIAKKTNERHSPLLLLASLAVLARNGFLSYAIRSIWTGAAASVGWRCESESITVVRSLLNNCRSSGLTCTGVSMLLNSRRSKLRNAARPSGVDR